MSGSILLFALLSLLLAITLVSQGWARFPSLNMWQRFGWGIWSFLFFGLTIIGMGGGLALAQGTRCIFDRSDETLIIERAPFRHSKAQSCSIYSVSHMAVTHNDEMNIVGLFLVLRSGEQIPLATLPPHDKPLAQHIAHEVRQFLRQPAYN